MATECVKNHSIAAAAALLMISEAIAKEHYARFVPNERFHQVFGQVFPGE